MAKIKAQGRKLLKTLRHPGGSIMLCGRPGNPIHRPSTAPHRLKTAGCSGIHRPIAYIFLSWATEPNMGSPQFNYLTDADSSWVATRSGPAWGAAAHGEPQPIPVYTADFLSLTALPNTTIDCCWFAEHDRGCKGLWVDQLLADGPSVQKAAVYDVVVAARCESRPHHSMFTTACPWPLAAGPTHLLQCCWPLPRSEQHGFPAHLTAPPAREFPPASTRSRSLQATSSPPCRSAGCQLAAAAS